MFATRKQRHQVTIQENSNPYRLKPAVWNFCLPYLAVRVNSSYLNVTPVKYCYSCKMVDTFF